VIFRRLFGETTSFLCFSSDFLGVHLFCSAADATGRIDGVHGNDRAACPAGAADMMQPNASPPALQDHPAAKTGKSATVKKANLRHRREANTRIQNERSNIAAETDASSGQQHDKSNTISAQPTATEVKSEILQSSELDDYDSVIKKAKATIAAKMENTASVEFTEMKRSTEKDTLGRLSSDVICGYVGKKTHQAKKSGADRFCISSSKTRFTSAT